MPVHKPFETTEAPVVRQSLGEVVYDRLLAAILAGQLVGGDELSEVTLAEQFGVSRTPVREALNRLAIDGLVANGRNRRATVRTFTREVVLEIYQLRQCLESGAARWAAGRIDAKEIARLRNLAAAAEPNTAQPWHEAAFEFDMELHRSIARHCNNRRLNEEIRRYSNFVPILQRLAGKRDDRLQTAYEQHLRILDAVARGDADCAAREMSDHIGSALTIILNDVFTDAAT